MLSFTALGGIFERGEINVPRYKYTIENIEKMLKNKFKKIIITEGSDRSQSVNYEGKIKSYDIYALGPRN